MAGVNPRMFNLTNKTRNMDKEELKEVMGLLRAAGMQAMLCDTLPQSYFNLGFEDE